jgi:hypothetical protein
LCVVASCSQYRNILAVVSETVEIVDGKSEGKGDAKAGEVRLTKAELDKTMS